MLELIKLVKALSNTTLFTDLECVYARCSYCGHIFDGHLCEKYLVDAISMLMSHQEEH